MVWVFSFSSFLVQLVGLPNVFTCLFRICYTHLPCEVIIDIGYHILYGSLFVWGCLDPHKLFFLIFHAHKHENPAGIFVSLWSLSTKRWAQGLWSSVKDALYIFLIQQCRSMEIYFLQIVIWFSHCHSPISLHMNVSLIPFLWKWFGKPQTHPRILKSYNLIASFMVF